MLKKYYWRLFFLLLISFSLMPNIYAVEKVLVLDFSINSGSKEKIWISEALSLDISDNFMLLDNFQTVSFAEKEKGLSGLSKSQRQDPVVIGELFNATQVVIGELVEEKNSIICFGKIYNVGKAKSRPITFNVSGRTKWLLDFSEDISWKILDLLNLRKFTKEDEDRLRFKIKDNKRLKFFLETEKAYISGDYAKALAGYKRFMEDEPGFITTHLRLADIYFKFIDSDENSLKQSEYFTKINDVLKKALNLDHRNRRIYYYLGVLYSHNSWVGRDYQTGVKYFKQATACFPYYTEAYRALAYLYAEKMKEYEKAINVYDRISAYDPTNPIIEKDIEYIFNLSQGVKYFKH